MSEVSYRDELAAHYKAVRGRLNPQRIAPVQIQFHNSEPETSARKTDAQVRKELNRANRDILYIASPHRVMGKHVVGCVAKHYDVTIKELRSNKRVKRFIDARHVICYLAREICRHLSYPEIGKLINKDHASTMNGYKRVKVALERGDDWAEIVPILRKKLEDMETTEFVRENNGWIGDGWIC